jgi:hypothetical protein
MSGPFSLAAARIRDATSNLDFRGCRARRFLDLEESRSQRVTSVVQRPVELASCAAEVLGEDVDRHVVEDERGEHVPLSRTQRVPAAAAKGLHDGSRQAMLYLEADLASLPRPPAERDGGFA